MLTTWPVVENNSSLSESVCVVQVSPTPLEHTMTPDALTDEQYLEQFAAQMNVPPRHHARWCLLPPHCHVLLSCHHE